MMTDVKLEIGESHSSQECRCLCRLSINGERRGKLSLSRAEAIKLGRLLESGARQDPISVTVINLPTRAERRAQLLSLANSE